MTIAQQIVAGDRVTPFAIETQKTAETAFDPAMAVGRIDLP